MLEYESHWSACRSCRRMYLMSKWRDLFSLSTRPDRMWMLFGAAAAYEHVLYPARSKSRENVGRSRRIMEIKFHFILCILSQPESHRETRSSLSLWFMTVSCLSCNNTQNIASICAAILLWNIVCSVCDEHKIFSILTVRFPRFFTVHLSMTVWLAAVVTLRAFSPKYGRSSIS